MKPDNPKTNFETAVKVDNVYKSFRLPTESQNSIKNLFISGFKKNQYKKLDILNDINFEIKHGEFYGIVGRNGSGKSTLLKLIAGIYTPDKGGIHINGKLTPFIELGVGFNPELTGKENIYLNGALLGFSRKEMSKIYPKIVEFSELEEFMDQKLKNYSSGMQVRLAFSIAIQSKSDILLFDEVLAVGDESFQRKCFDTFERYRAEQKTIILVSHEMSSVRKFCTRAMLVDDGKIVDIGEPSKIASMYSKLNQKAIDKETEKNNRLMKVKSQLKAKITNVKGESQTSFKRGDKLLVHLSWPKSLDVKNLGVAIIKESGEYIFGNNTLGSKGLNIDKKNRFKFEVELNFGYGRYHISCGLFGKTGSDIIEFVSRGPNFIIQNEEDTNWDGLISLPSKWIGDE